MSWRCYGIFWDLHGIFNQHRSTLFNQHPDSWATCSPRNLTPPVEASDSCAWLRCCWEVAVLWPHSCQGSPDDKIFGIQREELKSATAWWFQTCFFFYFPFHIWDVILTKLTNSSYFSRWAHQQPGKEWDFLNSFQ